MADAKAIIGNKARPHRIGRERTTNASVIYRDLQRQIVRLTLKPGTMLGEQMLAQRYGVSRTPVREALIRLSEERLVDVLPQQGTFVSRLDIAIIPEAVVIRQALEGATVRNAARVATQADIARLDEIIAEQKFHRDRNAIERFMATDDAFHEAIAEIAGLPGVWSYLKPAKVHIDRARWLTLPFLGRTAPVVVEHEEIRNAIAAHDEAAALAAIGRHLEAVIPDAASLRTQFSDYFI
ncbi:MAG TPA: GntR family transcriptional regulator [Devosia sp.]|nr:GntR family transcriptional regulator [Devosia sp.]